ncbi:MAG: dockerin type I domain-containing protein [Rubripirellula sp.]
MNKRTKRAKLCVQILEDRCLLNAHMSDFLGIGNHTISIAPDDTQFGYQTSNLTSVFDQRFGADAWRETLRDAAQTWVPHANVNFGFVDDDGSAAGIQGPWRGDERFGDIRVFGVQLDDAVWAQAIGGNARVAGTWAGDLVFNTNANWTSLEQVRAAAVHEIGHVLGLQHSDDPLSVMSDLAGQLNLVPSEADIEELQALFGEREHDYADAEKRNDQIKRASRISGSGEGNESEDFNGSQIWLQFGDITVGDDVDHYRINLADNAVGEMTIGVRTNGFSLASLEAAVLNRDGEELASVNVKPESDWALMTIDSSTAERVYLKIEGGSSDHESIGGYGVMVASPEWFATSNEVNTTWVENAYRWHQNSRFGDRGYSYRPGDAIGGAIWSLAEELLDQTGPVDIVPMIQTAERTVYNTVGELVTVDEIDQYSIRLPQEIDPNHSLRIDVHSLNHDGVVPDIEVVSLSGGSLEVRTTSRGYGVTQLLVDGFTASEQLMVQVQGGRVADGYKVGAYSVNAELSSQDFNEVMLLEGQLDHAQRSKTSTFTLSMPKIAKFNLAGASQSLAAKVDGAALILEIFDAELHPIYTFAGPIDCLRSMSGVVLPLGTYHARASIAYRGSESVSVSTRVTAEFYADPIGPLAPPLGEDPMLECLIGGPLCLPDSESHEHPVVVLPESTVSIPDRIWVEPINLGDDWYWGSGILPLEQPAGDGVLGGVTQDGGGDVIVEPPTTENAGTGGTDSLSVTGGTNPDGIVGDGAAAVAGSSVTGSSTFGAAGSGVTGSGAAGFGAAGFGASAAGPAHFGSTEPDANTQGDAGAVSEDVGVSLANTVGATAGVGNNTSTLTGFADAASFVAGGESTADALSEAANVISNIDQLMSGFAADVSVQLDVNRDQLVTAADALVIINFMASRGSGSVVNDASAAMDANGDGQVTAIDVLRVINQITRVR